VATVAKKETELVKKTLQSLPSKISSPTVPVKKRAAKTPTSAKPKAAKSATKRK
jgi:hypothetical protein